MLYYLNKNKTYIMKLFEINNVIIDFNVYVNNFNCLQNEIDGKYYEINQRYIDYEVLYSNIPLYFDNLDELHDGIYMWMLLTCNNDAPTMFITQSQNINEIGTKHSNIIHRLNTFHGKTKIFMHYAGELKKEGTIIKMNFSSGSYMREIFENNYLMNMNTRFDLDYRLYYMEDIMKYLTKIKYKHLQVLFTENDKDTFINQNNLPLKKEHLDLYKKCNCEILFFNDTTECKQYLENKKKWDHFYNNTQLYDMHKKKYDFLKPPQRPAFKFEGMRY